MQCYCRSEEGEHCSAHANDSAPFNYWLKLYLLIRGCKWPCRGVVNGSVLMWGSGRAAWSRAVLCNWLQEMLLFDDSVMAWAVKKRKALRLRESQVCMQIVWHLLQLPNGLPWERSAVWLWKLQQVARGWSLLEPGLRSTGALLCASAARNFWAWCFRPCGLFWKVWTTGFSSGEARHCALDVT